MPISLHGKEYFTVPERMALLKEEIGIANYSMDSTILHHDSERVIVKVELIIDHEDKKQSYAGHAEELRDGKSNPINRTSALENAETSALGRALAAAGWAGTEMASAEELLQALTQQQGQPQQQPAQQQQPSALKTINQPQPDYNAAAVAQQQGAKRKFTGDVDRDIWGKAKAADAKAAYSVLDQIVEKSNGEIDRALDATGPLAEECNLKLAEIVQGPAGNPNDDGLPF